MEKNDILELLKQHENNHIEYKKSENELTRDFWETYSAFANTQGGYILLGVSEDKNRNPKITGVASPDKIITDLVTLASNKTKVNLDLLTSANIKTFDFDGKKIIAVYIPEAPIQQKPIYLHNTLANSYLRKHDADVKVSVDELSALIRNHSDSLDTELLSGYSMDDLDLESIVKYQAILQNRNPNRQFIGMDPFDFLTEIGVFRYDYADNRKLKLTLGGLLFFGKYNAIVSKLPHYHVDFFDKRGANERWADRISAGDLDFPDMNLFNYYTIVFEKLLASIDRPFELDARMARKSYAELNVALREMFVNMIVHADYLSNSTSLIVEIHNPYYLFTNPGIMKIPAESFFKIAQSKPRNNILVLLFTRMGASEHAGTGSQKILNVVTKNKFKEPEIYTSLEKTIFKLWIATLADVTPDLTELERKIYVFMSEEADNRHVYLSSKEILTEFSQESPTRVKKSIRNLVKKELLDTIGGNRNRKYAIKLTSLEVIKSIDDISKEIKNNF